MSTHNMYSQRNKKNIMWIPPLICSYEACYLELYSGKGFLPKLQKMYPEGRFCKFFIKINLVGT